MLEHGGLSSSSEKETETGRGGGGVIQKKAELRNKTSMPLQTLEEPTWKLLEKGGDEWDKTQEQGESAGVAISLTNRAPRLNLSALTSCPCWRPWWTWNISRHYKYSMRHCNVAKTWSTEFNKCIPTCSPSSVAPQRWEMVFICHAVALMTDVYVLTKFSSPQMWVNAGHEIQIFHLTNDKLFVERRETGQRPRKQYILASKSIFLCAECKVKHDGGGWQCSTQQAKAHSPPSAPSFHPTWTLSSRPTPPAVAHLTPLALSLCLSLMRVSEGATEEEEVGMSGWVSECVTARLG